MVDLKGKKALVIDDFSEFRYTIRKMLQSLGATEVDDTGDGNTAVEKIAMKAYDLIMCDYNLGEGKRDGQQILEEVKFRKLVKYSTIYIMVTAENTMRMVMGALEYKPDDYLTKPFTKEILVNRLEKVMEKKKDFEDIEKALNREEYLNAIQICNQRIKEKPKNVLEFLRIKGDLLVTVGDYKGAGKVYEDVLAMRNIPWAALGHGKVNYFKANYTKAKEIFQDLIEDNRMLLEAYDWLAKCLEELGDLDEAQRVLVQASELSPKAILRQKALAEVSMKNKDLNTAEKSFKEAVSLGKTSCFKSPSDYTGLAKVLVSKSSPEKALEILSEANATFDDDSAKLQTSVMESIVHKEMGQEEEAKKNLEEASKLFAGMSGRVNSGVAMDMAKAFFLLGEKDKGNKIMQDVVRNHHDDEKILKKAQDVFTDVNMGDEGDQIIASTRKEIVQINNDGVKLVQAGKLKEAIDFFEKAASGLPENKIINANAAQALLMYMQKHGKNDRFMYQSRKYLEKIRVVDPSYKKYQSLLSIYEKIATPSEQAEEVG